MPADPARDDARLLLLSEHDNVLVTCVPLKAGSQLRHGGQDYTLTGNVALGHKIARRAIPAGAVVLKYGAPIGSATCDIAPGEHVHVHNLQSDYVAFHGHEPDAAGGDDPAA